MNSTWVPVSFCRSKPPTCADAFWLTNLASPGCAFIQSTSDLRSSAGSVFFAISSIGLIEISPIGAKSVLQIVIEIVDDAADMGVPLADVDGVAVGRGAREPPDADAAAGAADILDDHRLAERCPHLVRHDPRRDVGRPAGRERHDQRDGARRKIVGASGGYERDESEREGDK